MNKNTLFILALSLTTLASCRQTTKTPATQTAESLQATPLTFSAHHVVRKTDTCDINPDVCATATINYVVAEGGPQALRDSLNNYIQQSIILLYPENSKATGIQNASEAAEALATDFTASYKSYLEEIKELGEEAGVVLPWEIEINVDSAYHTSKITSLRTELYTFTGGAHPMSGTFLQSFDNTGKRISLAEMITDTTQLKKLAERELRRVHKIAENQTLEEAGLFIKGNNLPLSRSAALTAEGLILYYNPYEIAAYVYGPTQLTLSFEQLDKLLKPAYRP